ncbi:hypothetical protein G7Y89_g6896 [Cudoniella acicularis]|uniref:Ankyrin repeat protein n=1 Tax=Cudoniella acicularis TaxID=354080 RepID=A0A8H4W214_9HELO|nr:hypothetical protein G7Y89_g6896 [Cudoniella acicularis]
MGGLSKLKCKFCRTQKKKCVPEDRRWDENGGIEDRQRCEACEKGGHRCGPGVKVPKKSKGDSPPSKQRSNETRNMEGSELGTDSDGEIPYSLGGGADMKLEKSRRLKERLKNLDYFDEIFKHCCRTITSLESMNAILPHHHPYKHADDTSELSRIRSSAKEHLLVTLAEIKHLAASATENGDPNVAERAYSRAVKVCASPPLNSNAVYVDLLRDAASFYMKNGDYVEAERHLQNVLKVPQLSEDIKANALCLLTRATQASTKEITKLFWSSEMGRVKTSVQVPFPQSHRLMAAVPPSAPSVAAAVMSLECKAPDITGFPRIHNAILLKHDDIVDVIRSCSHEELLESRDVYRRTSLFFAACCQAEDVGLSIMSRFADHPTDTRKRLMNERDTHGNTILAISILSSCSPSFIKVLIENGSEVKPPEIMQGSYTPLRAAAMMGSLDNVIILQSHGAKDHESQIGNPNALQHAIGGGHHAIVEQLQLSLPS